MYDDNMNLEMFERHIRNKEFYGPQNLYTIVELIDRYIKNKEEIKEFYPKNIFVKEEELKVYLFMPNEVFAIENRIDSFILNRWKYESIEKMELTYKKTHPVMTMLNIRLMSGDEINLNSSADTNDSWAPKFAEKLLRIYSLIG